ncbi:hypothetical protein AAII07_42520 [Microvirga sp. 0TCS3.31]
MKVAVLTAVLAFAVPLVSPVGAAPVTHAERSVRAVVDWAQMRRGGAARRGFVARGPRGGVVAGRRTAVVRPGYRPGYRPVRPLPRPVVVAPGWRRPAAYWWRPGAAVAAGAAVGFVSAAAATAYVNSGPPGPGYCWYYTNPQRTQGFWDVCPR